MFCKVHLLVVLPFLPLALLATSTAQTVQPRSEAALRALPIALGDGDHVKLLQKWWAEGSAAGNVNDWYDNRDGDHSPFDVRRFPQLQRVVYTPDMIRDKVHWAAARQVHPFVVLGNSSTSAPPNQGGSNPRQYYSSTNGLAFLAGQYLANNLYVYPEHRDHDPGRNGLGPGGEEGFGDLYPTNTPYLLISQGSSGSDQPILHAVASVLAAFRPDVKTKLVDNGMLMPTVQMIFRMAASPLQPGDYLTGKAHPTAFDGGRLDVVKMLELAHGITVDDLPPLVRLKVLAEERPRPGADFFEPSGTEKLADTPQVVARIFRGKEQRRRMIVSAELTKDLNNRPLRFEWKVLRGDPDDIHIRPKNDAGSVVEIDVGAPKRRPVVPSSPLESNRIDIGVFAHNGKHWSAPGFVTWFGIDHEARTYDDKGRVAEIAYGSGEVRFNVADWWKLLAPKFASWFPPLTGPQKTALESLTRERDDFHKRVPRPAGDSESDPFAFKVYDKQLREFEDRQKKRFNETFAATHLPRLQELVKSDLLKNPDFLAAEKAAAPERTKAVANLAERIARQKPTFDPKSPDRPLDVGATAFDREMNELLNAERLLQIVFGDAVSFERHINFVDPRISLSRKWRDVYLYDDRGTCVGWIRRQLDRNEQSAFTADGLLIAERDNLGRCSRAKGITYSIVRPSGILDAPQLQWAPATETIEYDYANDMDRRGRPRPAKN